MMSRASVIIIILWDFGSQDTKWGGRCVELLMVPLVWDERVYVFRLGIWECSRSLAVAKTFRSRETQEFDLLHSRSCRMSPIEFKTPRSMHHDLSGECRMRDGLPSGNEGAARIDWRSYRKIWYSPQLLGFDSIAYHVIQQTQTITKLPLRLRKSKVGNEDIPRIFAERCHCNLIRKNGWGKLQLLNGLIFRVTFHGRFVWIKDLIFCDLKLSIGMSKCL
jgi:hypothetical protein